jgi:serine/threonine protein kinase
MSQNIDDQILRDLLEGKLSSQDEQELEHRIATDPELRARWEQLTGSAEWPIGCAPLPQAFSSEYLTSVLDRMKRTGPIPGVSNASSDRFPISEDEQLRQLNEELQGFRIVREVGRGGMGIVYEAIDEALQRRVAIKLLKPIQSDDGTAQERLLREAQAIAAIQHENILSIYGVQFVANKPVLIEQFVDGESLQKRIGRDGALPIEDCLSISLQIAKGLVAAHASQMVHRDLKPDNILIDGLSQVIRIADFGLAKRGESSKLTSDQFVAGTPSFMSPEQTEGKPVDSRSDLFSLGVIMYVMVTGVVPFDHPDPFVVFEMLRRKKVEPATNLRAETPPWLSRLIAQLLSKDPKDRISSAQEVVRYLEHKEFSSRESKTRRWRWPAVVSILVLTMGVFALFYFRKSSLSTIGWFSTSMDDLDRGANKRGVWIEGQERNYPSIADAIDEATDGQTIYLDSDIAEAGIQVRDKSLTIMAQPGTKPTIRYADPRNRDVSYFLRTNRNLSLRGLQFDWRPGQSAPIFEEGQLNNLISTDYDTELVVEDCEFHSTQIGAILGFGGNARVIHSSFSGELFALGCLLQGGRVEVADCTFRCPFGMTILYPPAARMVTDKTRFVIERSKFVGKSAIDIVLTRPYLLESLIEWHDCQLDTEQAIVITRSGQRAPEIESTREVDEWVHRLIQWQETNCRHRSTGSFIGVRTIRQPKKIVSETRTMEAWQSFWASDPDGESFVKDASLESIKE